MSTWDALQGIAIALGLGLLVGLQRERAASSIAGIRTFALITLSGALAGLLSTIIGVWIVGATLLAVVAMAAVENLATRAPSKHGGITTEVAIVVMFAVGALCMLGPVEVALVVTGCVYVLLHAKAPLRKFVTSLGAKDLTAIAQLVLVSLVILPILPDQTFGPYDVLNPRNIWWMVMLVVSMSLAAYVAYKLVGDAVGVLVSGVLGGLISSTATTVSHSRLARGSSSVDAACAVIVIASTVLYARILFLIGVTGPSFLRDAAFPISTIAAVSIALAVFAWLRARGKKGAAPDQRNPANLVSALIFGAIYAVVLLAVAAAKDRFGAAGIYATAAIGGMTDLDAITLSTTKLVADGGLEPSTGWRAIVLATISNTVVKAGIVGVIAGMPLLVRIGAVYGIVVAASVLVMLFWPAAAQTA